MDKARFIESAPRYYALAILSHLMTNQSATTINVIVNSFADSHPDDPDESVDSVVRIRYGTLLDRALKLLAEKNLIVSEKDDFGPTLIEAVEWFEQALEREPDDSLSTLFRRFQKMGNQRNEWLQQALDGLANHELRLGVTDEDYEDQESEWSPIPVDRDQPETQAVIKAIDDVAEKIQADNGYSATHAEERKYVLDGLLAFGQQLKSAATISVPYIKQYAIDPIARAGKTLGKSVAGLAVEVLKAKLKEWMMRQGIPWPPNWM